MENIDKVNSQGFIKRNWRAQSHIRQQNKCFSLSTGLGLFKPSQIWRNFVKMVTPFTRNIFSKKEPKLSQQNKQSNEQKNSNIHNQSNNPTNVIPINQQQKKNNTLLENSKALNNSYKVIKKKIPLKKAISINLLQDNLISFVYELDSVIEHSSFKTKQTQDWKRNNQIFGLNRILPQAIQQNIEQDKVNNQNFSEALSEDNSCDLNVKNKYFLDSSRKFYRVKKLDIQSTKSQIQKSKRLKSKKINTNESQSNFEDIKQRKQQDLINQIQETHNQQTHKNNEIINENIKNRKRDRPIINFLQQQEKKKKKKSKLKQFEEYQSMENLKQTNNAIYDEINYPNTAEIDDYYRNYQPQQSKQDQNKQQTVAIVEAQNKQIQNNANIFQEKPEQIIIPQEKNFKEQFVNNVSNINNINPVEKSVDQIRTNFQLPQNQIQTPVKQQINQISVTPAQSQSQSGIKSQPHNPFLVSVVNKTINLKSIMQTEDNVTNILKANDKINIINPIQSLLIANTQNFNKVWSPVKNIQPIGLLNNPNLLPNQFNSNPPNTFMPQMQPTINYFQQPINYQNNNLQNNNLFSTPNQSLFNFAGSNTQTSNYTGTSMKKVKGGKLRIS